MARKTVLAFGTFDLLHPGHLSYLRQAKRLGRRLTVIVARDVNVQRIKHRKPLFDERQRLAMVRALKKVDQAVLGFADDLYKSVARFKPDVIALGYDQGPSTAVIRRELAKRGLHPRIARCKPFKPRKHKSTHLKQRLRGGN
ncbi:MAG TPA: FAD synthase [Candidatus Diapherotrites archaeon]|uniref:FAD synthase n=1 Tax=Candidatus Iainarchaeum sp. TaxID=3101447 RepID=A0A7J4JG99_9ARCH|nr:FAD synthase [Candidatus Diapherotrites archaeon]HIH16728.1 FAD synthase [Candidatus Diapherotrites archaeon]